MRLGGTRRDCPNVLGTPEDRDGVRIIEHWEGLGHLDAMLDFIVHTIYAYVKQRLPGEYSRARRPKNAPWLKSGLPGNNFAHARNGAGPVARGFDPQRRLEQHA